MIINRSIYGIGVVQVWIIPRTDAVRHSIYVPLKLIVDIGGKLYTGRNIKSVDEFLIDGELS